MYSLNILNIILILHVRWYIKLIYFLSNYSDNVFYTTYGHCILTCGGIYSFVDSTTCKYAHNALFLAFFSFTFWSLNI